MGLLSIVQDAAREIGIAIPASAYGSTDDQIAQLVRLANKDGRELVKRFAWQALTKEMTFNSLAQEQQTGMVPTDFDHFVDETFFNRSRQQALVGPLTAQEWQIQKSVVSSVLTDAFRRRGNHILIVPVPPAGHVFSFEYVSKNWVDTDADGEGEADAFGNDNHASLIDDELHVLGLIWRFKRARGLSYGEDFNTYESAFARLKGTDGGKRVMDLVRPSRVFRPVPPQVPEGSWSV